MSLDFDPLWNAGGPSGQGWSEIAPFFRCPKEYQLSRIRGLSVPMSGTPDYFYVGSALHAGRAMWLSRKCGLSAETMAAVETELMRIRAEYELKLLPVRDKAVVEARRYMAEYVEHYSMKPAPRTVAVEHMLGPHDMTGEGHMRTARLDDVSYYEEAGGVLSIGEFKTGVGAISQTVSEYQLHGQPYLQWLLWKACAAGEAQYGPVQAIVLDVMQKGIGEKKCTFGRVVVTPEPFSLAWYEKWLKIALRQIAEMNSTSDVPRNISACAKPRLGPWGTSMGACQFRNLCTYGPDAARDFVGPNGVFVTEGEAE